MTDWTTIDFKPAPHGWRAVYVFEDQQTNEPAWTANPVAGWLIQRDERGNVRVIAAVTPADYGGEVEEVSASTNLWRVLGPKQSDPTAEELATELEHQKWLNTQRAGTRTEAN